jgi:hypothetical protein
MTSIGPGTRHPHGARTAVAVGCVQAADVGRTSGLLLRLWIGAEALRSGNILGGAGEEVFADRFVRHTQRLAHSAGRDSFQARKSAQTRCIGSSR